MTPCSRDSFRLHVSRAHLRIVLNEKVENPRPVMFKDTGGLKHSRLLDVDADMRHDRCKKNSVPRHRPHAGKSETHKGECSLTSPSQRGEVL